MPEPVTDHAAAATPGGDGVPRPWLIVAAVTPMTAGGDTVDLDAVAPMVEFLQRHGADGVLAAGTTGEGVLLEPAERRALTEPTSTNPNPRSGQKPRRFAFLSNPAARPIGFSNCIPRQDVRSDVCSYA